MTREYQFAIGSPAFFLTTDLVAPPVITTQITRPTTGRSELRPFRVEVLDTGGQLTAALTAGGRWIVIGQPAAVLILGGAIIANGRVSNVSEGDGPGKYIFEVSNESWVARRARLFSDANTVQIWPAGIKAEWRGFEAAEPGTAFNVISGPDGTSSSLRVLILRGFGRGKRVTDPLVNYIREQLVENPVRAPEADGSTNNFGPMRLHYNGTDYPVISFGTDVSTPDFTNSLDRDAARIGEDGHTQIYVVFWEPVAPPPNADGFLHLTGAPPSETIPLHIGIADPLHTYGTTDGFIHPATLTRRIWDELGVRYDSPSLTALEADSSFPALAPRVTEQVDNAEEWLAGNVWGPCMLVALTAVNGLRKLVDMRLPADLDPDTLPILDASNSARNTWSLAGRETVNSIKWSYLSLQEPSQERRAVRKGSNTEVTDNPNDADLDGLIAEERETDPIEGDTIAEIGRRNLDLKLLAALEPTADTNRRRRAIAAGGVVWQGAVPALSRELLDIFQDGAYRFRGEVGRTVAETLEEGDLVLLDLGSLQLPNPVSGARSDLRLVRLLSIERHPAHAVGDFLDLGPNAQPLAAPTVDITWTSGNPGVITVTLSDIPAGATAELQVAYTATSAEPSRWPVRRAGLANGVYTFTGVPAAGFAHARARSTAPHRIRSIWARDFVSIGDRPAILNAAIALDAGGVPTLSIAHSSATLGVRLRLSIHDPNEYPSYGGSEDHSVSEFPLLLAGVAVPSGAALTIELEPWTGFSAGSVTGTAGIVVTASTDRSTVNLPLAMAIDVDLSVADEAEVTVAVADPLPGRNITISYTADGAVTPASPQTLVGTNVTSDLDTTGSVVFIADLTSTSIVRFVAKAPGRIQASQTVTFGIQGAPGTPGVAGRIRIFGTGGVAVTDATIEVQHETGESGELFVWVNPSSVATPDQINDPPDGSVVFASTPFVANNATSFALTGGGFGTLLNNIPVTAQQPKTIFARAEFDDGTVAEASYVLPGIVQIVDPDGILAGNVVGSTNIQDDAIQTPHMSANSVTADAIAARQVTVEKLTVGSFANLIPDAGFESGDLADSEWTVTEDGGGTFDITGSLPRTGGFCLDYNRQGQTADAGIKHASSGTECNPGDPFYMAAWFRGTGAGSGTSAAVVIRFLNEAGAQVGIAANFDLIPVGSYNLVAIEGVAPAGAVSVNFELTIANDGTTQAIRIDDVYANRQTPGELVVDGAITAPKINVVQLDAIAADVGDLIAGRLRNNVGVAGQAGILLSGAVPSGWRRWVNLTQTGAGNAIRFGPNSGSQDNADATFRVQGDGDVHVGDKVEIQAAGPSIFRAGILGVAQHEHVSLTASGTGGSTSEVNLKTYGLPALEDGDIVEITASGTVTGNLDTKAVRLNINQGISNNQLGETINWASIDIASWSVSCRIVKQANNIRGQAFTGKNNLGESLVGRTVSAGFSGGSLSTAIVQVKGQTLNSSDEVTCDSLFISITRARP